MVRQELAAEGKWAVTLSTKIQLTTFMQVFHDERSDALVMDDSRVLFSNYSNYLRQLFLLDAGNQRLEELFLVRHTGIPSKRLQGIGC